LYIYKPAGEHVESIIALTLLFFAVAMGCGLVILAAVVEAIVGGLFLGCVLGIAWFIFARLFPHN